MNSANYIVRIPCLMVNNGIYPQLTHITRTPFMREVRYSSRASLFSPSSSMAATKTKINHPSFLKIMFDDLSTKLRVPPAFSNNFKHVNMIRIFNVFLRSSDLKLSWSVTVKRSREDGCHYFTRGWRKMAKDLQLGKGDLLVFYLVGDDAFEVAVYDRTSCKKEITPPSTSSRRHGSTLNKETKVDEEESLLTFERTLSIHHLKSMNLPVKFVRAAKLSGSSKVSMIDPDGKKWPIVIQERKLIRYVKCCLLTGWSDFIQVNGFAVGDTLKFKFVGGCKIQVKVVSIGCSSSGVDSI